MLTLPGDLEVRVLEPDLGVLTVSAILAVPAVATGMWWDGYEPAGGSQETAIRFKFGWDARMAGLGFEDMCRDAVTLAAHLAARIPGWPSAEVHVRPWPQVDWSFQFECGPAPIPAMPQMSFNDGMAMLTAVSPEMAERWRNLEAEYASLRAADPRLPDLSVPLPRPRIWPGLPAEATGVMRS